MGPSERLIWRPLHAAEITSLLRWAEARLPGLSVRHPECWAMGVVAGGQVVAAVLFNGYRPGHMVEIGIVSDHPAWCTRRVLKAAFGYAFDGLQVTRVQTATHRRNRKARRLAERLGFTFEGIARQGWPTGGDAAVYSMLRRECRWIEDHSDGQKLSLRA